MKAITSCWINALKVVLDFSNVALQTGLLLWFGLGLHSNLVLYIILAGGRPSDPTHIWFYRFVFLIGQKQTSTTPLCLTDLQQCLLSPARCLWYTLKRHPIQVGALYSPPVQKQQNSKIRSATKNSIPKMEPITMPTMLPALRCESVRQRRKETPGLEPDN